MSTFHEKIKDEIKDAMRARDSVRLEVLRSLLTEFINELVATKRKPGDILPDVESMQVVRRAVKQRKDSIEQFKGGERLDLAEKEEAELVILKAYLPSMMNKDEIYSVVRKKISDLKITDKSQMGMLMGALMKEFKGSADGGDVKEVVDELLN